MSKGGSDVAAQRPLKEVLDALVAGQMSLDEVEQDFANRTWPPVSYMPDEDPPEDIPLELQGFWVAEQDFTDPDPDSWATVDDYLDLGKIDEATYQALADAKGWNPRPNQEQPESLMGDQEQQGMTADKAPEAGSASQ